MTEHSHAAIVIWDIREMRVSGSVREDVFHSPHCVGSLIKPFVLLAYLEEQAALEASGQRKAGQKSEPIGIRPCAGKATPQCPVDCWFKSGHGRLPMKEALAQSCNQYFYQIAENTSRGAFLRVLHRFGLSQNSVPEDGSLTDRLEDPRARIGLDPEVQFIPLKVLRAYVTLLGGRAAGLSEVVPHDSHEAPLDVIFSALALSAARGTSLLAQRALPENQHLLGKTGTSPAFSKGRPLADRTDAWFLGLYPADQPAVAVLVHYPDGLGAKHAAPLGGQALKLYLDLVKP